jgi:hypothetical protein
VSLYTSALSLPQILSIYTNTGTVGFYLQNGICSCLIGTYYDGTSCKTTAAACLTADISGKRVNGVNAANGPPFVCNCPAPYVNSTLNNGQSW